MDVRGRICAGVDAAAEEMVRIARAIHERPELGFEEFEAARLLTGALEGLGACVERGAGGMETAFLARLRGTRERPCVGLIAEYDALPGIGHACGHNLIGAAAVGAMAGLAAVREELPGTAVVVGSPAEEGGGGKVFLLERGALEGIDAALAVHPRGGPKSFVATHPGTGGSLARTIVDLEFFGKAAHAASNPFEGINALDAVVLTYNGVSVLRQHLKPDARIHGVITHGGDAPNVIPAYAAMRYYVRARSRGYLAELVERVRSVAQGAAMQTGCRCAIGEPVPTYEETRANVALGAAFASNMEAVGMEVDRPVRQQGFASSDFGNVSQRMPAASAKFAISLGRVPGHSDLMREAACSAMGFAAMVQVAKAMALTAFEVVASAGLLDAARAEFSSAS